MSELWERKMKAHFDILDFDHDGVISTKNIESLALQFAERQNADKERNDKLLKGFIDVWQQWTASAEGDGKEILTLPTFIQSMRLQLRDPQEYKKIASEILRVMLSLMDVKVAGFLDKEEHRRLYDAGGVQDTSFAEEAFYSIDLDHDGKLSFDDFINGYIEFMLSVDDNNPYNLFLGPLD